jgi:hypothetical protein
MHHGLNAVVTIQNMQDLNFFREIWCRKIRPTGAGEFTGLLSPAGGRIGGAAPPLFRAAGAVT